MKSNSLEASGRKRRIRKIITVFAALLLGFLAAAEGRFAFFRITEITADNDMLSESAVWGVVNSKYERFWPAFLLHAKEYESLIERYYPVNAKLSLSGFGKFTLNISPLTPLYKIYWGGEYWFISEEGKLWLTTLPENKFLPSHKAFDRPVTLWSSDRLTPIDVAQSDGNVFTSVLPLNKIASWYEMLDILGWTKNVKYIHAEMNGDLPAVEIIFYAPDGRDGAVVLLPDETDKWGIPAAALKKLYKNGIATMPSDLYVDCIFSDKIRLKNRSASADIKVAN